MSTPDNYTYNTQAIYEGLKLLGAGTQEVETAVDQLRTNVELNFEGWAGASKAEFERVHLETTEHLKAVGQWLIEVTQNISTLVNGVEEDDAATAQRLSI
ncbi:MULTISPECIES: hypothetical protein [Streptomyces]|uniref:ESAT-6-like protein n=1 Tax=Streptomyces viridochromogenes TaxID=1938 RepID=A0A0L8JD91_STRVR|nr:MULTISPECIES: hypothetical protein [Streptomyces]KOG11606.1 hypothetical protein ADK34_33900 [Streptomyces viridochromogenes]